MIRFSHRIGFGSSFLLHMAIVGAIVLWQQRTANHIFDAGQEPIRIVISSRQLVVETSPASSQESVAEGLLDKHAESQAVEPAPKQMPQEQEISPSALSERTTKPPMPRPVEKLPSRPAPKQLPQQQQESAPLLPSRKHKALSTRPTRPPRETRNKSIPTKTAVAKASAKSRSVGSRVGISNTQTGREPAQNHLADIRANYKANLLAAIERNKFYPNRARRRGIEGEVKVAFTILLDGSITDIRITRSSGSKVLDQAAKGAIRRLERVNPLPAALGVSRLEIIVPLTYRLING